MILVAEDEGLIAFALEWALRLAGHEVLGPADSVAEAIRLSERDLPHLALIDIDLRNGDDGIQIARHLRERHGTPILFTTARLTYARDHRHLALGLIPKPYDPDVVLDIVAFAEEIVQGSRPRVIPNHFELFEHLN